MTPFYYVSGSSGVFFQFIFDVSLQGFCCMQGHLWSHRDRHILRKKQRSEVLSHLSWKCHHVTPLLVSISELPTSCFCKQKKGQGKRSPKTTAACFFRIIWNLDDFLTFVSFGKPSLSLFVWNDGHPVCRSTSCMHQGLRAFDVRFNTWLDNLYQVILVNAAQCFNTILTC